MKLSEKLKLLRELKGKTQEEVAQDLQIGITTLRNYENENLNRLPNTVQLKQLKKYYNVTYEYLLDDECENKTTTNINIGKELLLSDKSIEKIKNLQKTSYKHNRKGEVPYLSLAFNEFIENFNDFDNLVFDIEAIQRNLKLYKKIVSFLYLLYMDKLILKYIKEQNSNLKTLFSYFDKLMEEIQFFKPLYEPEFSLLRKLDVTYSDYRDSCFNSSNQKDNKFENTLYDKRELLWCSVEDCYSNFAMKYEFCSFKLNKYVTHFLEESILKYEIYYEDIVKNCFDDKIVPFLKENEELLHNKKRLNFRFYFLIFVFMFQ